jgi:flagellum-specific peptidoglycan hydrolase FlgJ
MLNDSFMGKIKFAFILLIVSNSIFANDNNNGTVVYIDAYVDIAISEMERTGIPASIKLAQAILESNAGKSEMAMMANNHFGIKCGNEWRGASYYKIDDDTDHRGRLIESCFRVYKDADESFIAHSNFLQNKGKPSRYSFLFEYEKTDYKKWAKGLKKAGYATDPHYPQKLINLIEKYELHRYDRLGSSNNNDIAAQSTDKKEPTTQHESVVIENETRVSREDRLASKEPVGKMPRFKYVNESKMTVAEGGETLNDLSNRTGIPLISLVEFNENLLEPYEKISPGTPIYLESKRLSLKGKQKFHTVKQGESMAEISQKYGIELEALYIRNRIPFGSEVRPGEEVQLKGMLRTGPKPKLINKGKTGLVEKSRFVEETVEYLFSPKNGNED